MSCNACTCENNKILKLEVDTKNIELIEKEHFEYNSYLELLTQFTSTSPYKPDMERYNELLEAYILSYTTYNVLILELADILLKANNIILDEKEIIKEIKVDFINELLLIELSTL